MRVIVVDDERNARENLKIKLQQLSMIADIQLFDDPFEALEYISQNTIDIAFLDIDMPEITGIGLAKRIKDINYKVNIVFVSGHSQYALDAFKVNASDFIPKPATLDDIQAALTKLRNPVLPSGKRIRIQTFGNFEVFIDRKPLQISRAKPKELLAYLVDKRGTPVTASQIAAILWEDKEYNRSLQNQTQTVISQLMKILSDVGIQDMIIKARNNLAVDTNVFDCDYYQFLEGNLAAMNMYIGEYMNEYSWAEMTAGMLNQKSIAQ